MATTDSKPGFRLPWSADRGETGSPADASTEDPLIGDPARQPDEHDTPEMVDAASPATERAATVLDGTRPDADSSAPVPARKPNKFMADLTRAMQAAAETARAETLSRFAAEAKGHVDDIQAGTASASAELRKKADDDVATIRDWSKTEIARIREETDERIAHRKTVLEREVEVHAAEIETRVAHVQRRVAEFETQMTSFFERLLAEDDPTRFAAMAESLPEPPSFDVDDGWEPTSSDDATIDVADGAFVPEVEATERDLIDQVDPSPPIVEGTADVVADASADMATDGVAEASAEMSPEQAGEGDLFGVRSDDRSPDAGADPRLTALGLDADFAAAEAEAADFTADSPGPDEEIPVIADDALAARLAGLVPEVADAESDTVATRVVVTGLVSVAAIAGFKRHLSRLNGVHSVGVSSGPDGEFVFAIVHGAELKLGDVITTLPGFQARISAESEGQLVVAARDPESEG